MMRPIALILAALLTLAPAHAETEPVLVRCTGYSANLVLMSGGSAGIHQPPEPFDLSLDPDRGIGWFGGLIVSSTRKGRLLTTPTTHEITAEGPYGGRATTEWVVLDRVTGALVGHFIQGRGSPTERLKWDGSCARIERRF